ncbi:MAG TPA: hypothetical protein DCX54_02060 [Flavobacteriales bacterium]|nr:hypothetical protein [Flavobacteriales bacterium]
MKIQDLLKMANDAYYSEKYDEAIKYYQQVLDRSPKNKQAQKQLAKAELKLSLKTAKPKVPNEALQLYKQARSFISANDLPQAKKLLKEAIAFAQQNGKKFPQAQELLDNLPNAFTADGFKQKALEQLKDKQWANAVVNLETAVNLDNTDESNKILLSHLQSLIKAQGLLSQLNAGIKDRKKKLDALTELQKIIDATNELAVLSPLWQEVVRLFGEFDSKDKNLDIIVRNLVWWLLGTILLLTTSISLLFLLPRSHPLVDCSETNGLEIVLNYPNFIANGDSETITLTIKNVGGVIFTGNVLIDFYGTAKIHFLNEDANKIPLENFGISEQKTTNIIISLDEPFSIFSNSGHYINFIVHSESINGLKCLSDDFHISHAPVYGIRKILWGGVVLALLSLFGSQIKKFLDNRK